MSDHGIHVFNFEFWRGPAPSLPQNQTVAYHRPGANDVAIQLIGYWGSQFAVELTSHHATLAAAVAAFEAMRDVVGTGWLAVKYANMNYTGLFSVGYHALSVQQVSTYTAGLIGPGYAYTRGGVLISRWQLQPETL